MTAHPLQEPKWRRLPEERPEQILNAALAVFSENGFAAARLDDIAKRAGLSKGTIYLYFPNKEDLFREVVRQKLVAPIKANEERIAASKQSATQDLVDYARMHWAFVRSSEFGPVFRLIVGEIQNVPDLAEFYGREVVSRGHRLLTAIIQRGIDSGEFRTADAKVAARMIFALVVMHGHWCAHRTCFTWVEGKTDDQVIDEVLQFYLNAIHSSLRNV